MYCDEFYPQFITNINGHYSLSTSQQVYPATGSVSGCSNWLLYKFA